MTPHRTPRERFEAQFGKITNEKWEWLKVFFEGQRTETRLSDVVGLQHKETNDMYYPGDFNFILRK